MNIEKQFIENSKLIQAYLFHKTGRNKELSEDLFQELYIKLRKIADAGKYTEEGKFLSFAKRIGSNMIIDHYRAEARVKTYFIEDLNKSILEGSGAEHSNLSILDLYIESDLDDEYVDSFVTEEIQESLDAAIELLPEAQKELITQRYFRNMTYKEIVLETGEKQSNLLPRMFHAKKNLKKYMK